MSRTRRTESFIIMDDSILSQKREFFEKKRTKVHGIRMDVDLEPWNPSYKIAPIRVYAKNKLGCPQSQIVVYMCRG